MPLIIKKQPSLGMGLYPVHDVAQILQLDPALVRRWLNEYWGAQFADQHTVTSAWGSGREKIVHFYTLVEFYVFYQLRKMGISAQRITKAHRIIGDEINSDFPFASSSVLTDGKKILYTTNGEDIIDADKTRQLNIKSIIEEFCKKIEFDGNDMALRYWPLGKGKNIIVDPHHQMGQPVVVNTNIMAEALWSLFKAGEKISFIANLYNVAEADVKHCIELFEKAA
jgi:uncharacterized protein (DUF433 family)